MTESAGIAGGQLLSIVERVERLNEEIEALNSDKKDIFAEAKANGFDVPTIKDCVKLRKVDPAERDEKEALFDLYWTAIENAADSRSSRSGTPDATRATRTSPHRSAAVSVGDAAAGVVSSLATKIGKEPPPDVPPAYRDTTRKPAGKALQS